MSAGCTSGQLKSGLLLTANSVFSTILSPASARANFVGGVSPYCRCPYFQKWIDLAGDRQVVESRELSLGLRLENSTSVLVRDAQE